MTRRQPRAAGRDPHSMSDTRDRDLIANALDDTLVVEAAAGTGKTTELVRRIVRIIEAGRAGEVRQIVAVTFTEKAAGELKLRLREALEEARQRSPGPGAGSREPVRDRLDAALATLEEAQVSTIHGFCGDLLRERPVEAGVDPLFTVLAEGPAARLFDQVFDVWLQRQLADPPEGIRRSLRRPAFGGFRAQTEDRPIERLRRAAWELAEWRDFDGAWQRDPFDRGERIDTLVDAVKAFSVVTTQASSRHDTLFQDTLPARRLAEEIERTEAAVPARDYDRLEAGLIELGRDRTLVRARKGRTRDYGPGLPREQVWQAREDLLRAIEQFEADANADLAALLQRELRECVAGYQDAKARAGALDFLDLLLRARDLVRDNPDVRRHFQEKFRYIFVDEFQDTDPLQAEVLMLLAADDPAVADWRQVRPVPGKLFIVGDPKQSIYRFRRADVGVYRRVCAHLVASGAKAVTLSTSFRARPNLQRAVNTAFAPFMTGDEATLQAKYVPLEPFRPDAAGQPTVLALPVPYPYANVKVAGSAIEKSLPQAVAALVEWLVSPDCAWTVAERPRADPQDVGFTPAKARGFKPGEGEHLVKLQARHICILFRRFVKYGDDQTRPYVEALEAHGVPHLLVGGRSFHEREEIETMRAALAAIEWPDDELSVFATLRGALFAIGDEELLAYRQRYGHFHPFKVPQELVKTNTERTPNGHGTDAEATAGRQSPAAGQRGSSEFKPIADALSLLQRLHRERNRVPVATTISALLEATRAHVGFVLRPEGEQALANVLHVADLAREYEADGGLSFRGFIEELRAQAEDGRASEAPILEEGSDGVRLMTVHKAKGLEFPVVILADITAKLRSGDASRYLDPDRRVSAVRIGGWSPRDLLLHAPVEEARDEAEGVRIAYVAATRARDLLVVPAVGDEAFPEGGWTSPLFGAVYPPLASRREQQPGPGCPPFKSKDSVLSRPNADPATAATVCPGLHRVGPSSSTEHRAPSAEVVWWDPSILILDAAPAEGVRRPELIVKDVSEQVVEAGLTEFRAWQARRADAIARGSQASLRVRTVREYVAAPTAQRPSPEVEFSEVPRVPDRPAGPRFGTLVHAALATVPLDADPERIRDVAAQQARVLGAGDEEAAAAAEIAGRVLAHDLLARARAAAAHGACRRETPVMMTLGEGTLVEGVVDLAFEDGGAWVVVDFKTDQELEAELDFYRRQVALYAEMVAAATGLPSRAVLMRI